MDVAYHVDGEIFREASRNFDFLSQQPRAKGMERAQPNVAGG